MALKALYFYGTLRHLPLLEAVLGRPCEQLDLVEAILPDHSVFWVKDQAFPMIAETAGARSKGIALRNPSDEDILRLNYYEGGFDYDLRSLQAIGPEGKGFDVAVYFPKPGLWARGEPWLLEDWQQDWGALSVSVAEQAMSEYGNWTSEDLTQKLPMMRRRAFAFLAAQARGVSADHRDGAEDVVVLKHSRRHSHFFALDQLKLTHPRYDGTTSEVLDREIFYVGEAATVLPYDPVQDAVLLTEQFRPNVYASGSLSPWVLEPVSGLIDPGETPEDAAQREAMEETGVTLDGLEHVNSSYSSTGSSTEFVHMYVGVADFGTLQTGGGLSTEGEDIRRLVLPFQEFAEGLAASRFRDMPLVTLGFWLMLNRERLRSSS